MKTSNQLMIFSSQYSLFYRRNSTNKKNNPVQHGVFIFVSTICQADRVYSFLPFNIGCKFFNRKPVLLTQDNF